MKERVTKLKLYASVLVKKIVFAWQTETAYAGNTVGELLSTVFYNITFLVFIDVILKKFKLIAGYSFPDMMVLTLISQTVFYAGLTFTYTSVELFIKSVRDGSFDTLLLKPVSVLFQVMTLGIRPFSGAFFSIPPLLIYIFLVIQQNAFHPSMFGLIAGIGGLIMGILFLHFFRFAFAMLVFKNKQIKNLLKTLEFLSEGGSYPYEAYQGIVKIAVLFLSPLLAGAGIPSLYFLDKTASLIPLAIEAGLLILFSAATIYLWKQGLKEYESASS